jgi:transposase
VDKILGVEWIRKKLFRLHGVNAAEHPALREKLRRKEMIEFFE